MANVILKKLTGNFKLKIDDLSRTMPMGQTRTLIQGELLLCENQTELGFSISQSDTITVNGSLFEGDLETLQELLGNTVFNEANDPSGRVISYTEGAPVLSVGNNFLTINKGDEYDRPLKIAIMGGSHAEGLNYPIPLPLEQRLYYRLGSIFDANYGLYGYSYPFSAQPIDIDPNGKNLGKFGYYSANWMSDGNNPNVDPLRNITKAVADKPDVIFAVFGSNEPNNSVPVDTALSRYKEIFDIAKSKGIRMCFTGTFPRNPYNAGQKAQLRELNAKLIEAVGEENVLDVLNVVGDANTNIKAEYNHDTVHLNGAGYQVVAEMFNNWLNSRQGINAIVGYEIQSSEDGVGGWSLYRSETDYTNINQVVDFNLYYRVRKIYFNGSASPWSDTVFVEEPIYALARFSFGNVGAESLEGWTNVFGDPNKGTINAVSNGISIKNNTIWPAVNGASAFNNTNTFGGILYMDHNGEEQLLSQTLTRSNWISGSSTGGQLLIENIPDGAYQLRVWSFTAGGGSWNINQATENIVAIGSTTVAFNGYKYYQNTDDRVKGVIINIRPTSLGRITVNVNWGTGATFGASINALELRQVGL